ncbi:BREX-1 system phosphatase PglZ type A [Sporolactobacillus nakayamae]|uniref:TIGR02687 family protein n=1 Tax=Sporolactobacillus nakayamae TaxID=269670 RepID=A0A1I2QRM2_9BACL|nr:BREX-1 system phosphatase PglZ type A [Sporolactobacillus nakayamae]SFG31245.1 TIGR02687 family protein [Sporolactobacillus nakayamae]
MNLKEVRRMLNELFQKPLCYGQKRHLVFWYDGAGDFKEDINDLQFDQIRVWKLTSHNLFATKYELEKKDPNSSFLIYAPMAKPAPHEDWLLDQLKMGMEFSTDKTTVIMRELGIADPILQPIVKHYAKFFNNKQRYTAFQSFEITDFDQQSIDVGVLSVLCRNTVNTPDEVVKTLMREYVEESNRSWEAIGKFGDPESFWILMERMYDYTRNERSLQDLFTFFLLTYLSGTAPDLKLPDCWKDYVSLKPMNIIVLMNQFMNQSDNRDAFQKLSELVASTIYLDDYLKKWDIQDYVGADAFRGFDGAVIEYIEAQLAAGVDQFDTYQNMINARRTLHWYHDYRDVYVAIEEAILLMRLDKEHQHFVPEASSYDLIQAYIKDYYRYDRAYRKFYTAYDRCQKDDLLITLREQVERVYGNVYMRELATKWTQGLKQSQNEKWPIAGVPQQNRFYPDLIQPFLKKNERVFVIISDAFRYEAGRELMDRLNLELRGTAEIAAMQSTLPSFTALGIPAMLPHHSIRYEISESGNQSVKVDDVIITGIEKRTLLLQKRVKESFAIRERDIRDLSRQEMRERLQSKKVIYIYHNRIDANGDHAPSESEVFAATTQAIDEITVLINKLVNNLSASTILVTADHGYLYQRDPIKQSDKLPVVSGQTLQMNRRFVIGDQKPNSEGTLTFSTEGLLSNDPPLFVTVPNGAERFMIQGAGANYVHGGAMLQEIVVPVVTFRNNRSNILRKVNAKLMSSSRKITTMILFLEFFQTEPVEEKVHPRRLIAYFIDSHGERITNENHLLADRSSEKPADRVYREKFVFKNRDYNRQATYFLVLEDEEENVEKNFERIPFTIDIAFSDGYGV